MRLMPFELLRPTSLEDALAYKAVYGDEAAFHAGGTELLVALKAHVLRYEYIIDLKQVPELRGIRHTTDGTLVIGALATHHAIANDTLVRTMVPGYAELSENVANIRVRMAGTLGGVLCFAEPHADAPTMLCALNAQLVLIGQEGERRLPVREFQLGEFTTARRDDEVLVAIEIPAQKDGVTSAYRCFGHTERPAVGVAAVWSRMGVQRLSLWTGAITGTPLQLVRTEQAASALSGDTDLSSVWTVLEPVLREEAGEIDAHDDLHGGGDYKRHLVVEMAHRALQGCLS